MKFCDEHWLQLKAAIAIRGLFDKVPIGGEAAMRSMKSLIEDGPSMENFDPLMMAHNQLCANALTLAGIATMFDNEDGSERCPYCYVLMEAPRHGVTDGRFDHWIDQAADSVKMYYNELVKGTIIN